MIENKHITLVSEEKATEMINNHKSFVCKTPICLNEKTKMYEYIKVELINGYTEGLFCSQLGNVENVFKYKTN